jgi:O-antigen/teichoic acid export membrane protein
MSHKRKILQGSASNMARVLLSMAVALVLPPLLVHRMAPAEYSAWVLILQCSAYVNLLDLGLQTAIGKFVAEYDALDDRLASSRILSNAFAILCLSALIGAIGIGIVVWRVPQLFHQMPVLLIGDLREGILAVGLSTVLALPFGAFSAVFTGLQKYGFPTALALVGKSVSTAFLVGLLLLHGTIVQLAWVIAVFNLAIGLGQFLGWRKYAKQRVDLSFHLIHRESALRLAKYGSVLSIWTVAILFVSGLDTVIVGHYDYKETGYYGLATSATNFMLLIIASLFSPLLPAASSLQAGQTAGHIGALTIKATRYCALLICLAALPLVFGAYPLLRLWVGHAYALSSALYLQVLVLGNAIRQLGYPYSLVVVATGKQHLATVAAITEALVNVGVSIYLVQRIGAVGVAIGTLVGAFVSLGMHLAVSMRFTHSAISMSRGDFVFRGILRPLSCIVPSVLLFLAWRRSNVLLLSSSWLAVWILSTLGTAWFVGLTSIERSALKHSLVAWPSLWKRKSDAV